MEFSPASQNGIMPPDQLYTRLTPHLMVATSSSAYWSAGLTVKVINTAPYPKTIPVSIQSQFTPTGSTSSSTVTVGEGYFDGATATIFLTNLGTGTNLLSAHWPGESRYQGFDYTMTTAINVLPGVPLSGGLNLSVSPTNYYGEPVNLTLTSYNTPSLNGTTATIYSNQYQTVSLSTGSQTTLYKVNGYRWGTFMNDNGVWVNNATDMLIGVKQTVHRIFNAPYTGNYSLKYSYDNIFNWIVDGTTISTATAYFDLDSPATVVVPLTQGQHSFEFDITNGSGSSWNTNPGGFGAVVANTTGTSIWNIKDHLDPAQENYQELVSSTASIVTFVNNIASYSTQYLSTGTVSYYATWPGRVLSNNQYYIKTNSNSTSTQVIKHTLDSLVLTASNGYAGEPINVTLTTTSTISLTGSTATIYANGITATNLTFTGNTATGTITFASTGSYVISGQWLGGRLSDNKYYNSKTSNTVTSVISIITPILTLNTSPYVVATATNFTIGISNTGEYYPGNTLTLSKLYYSSSTILGIGSITTSSIVISSTLNSDTPITLTAVSSSGNRFNSATTSTSVEVIPWNSVDGAVYHLGLNSADLVANDIPLGNSTNINNWRFIVSFHDTTLSGTATLSYKKYFGQTTSTSFTLQNGIGYIDLKETDIAPGYQQFTASKNGIDNISHTYIDKYSGAAMDGYNPNTNVLYRDFHTLFRNVSNSSGYISFIITFSKPVTSFQIRSGLSINSYLVDGGTSKTINSNPYDGVGVYIFHIIWTGDTGYIKVRLLNDTEIQPGAVTWNHGTYYNIGDFAHDNNNSDIYQCIQRTNSANLTNTAYWKYVGQLVAV